MAAFATLAIAAHNTAYFPWDLAASQALQATRNPVVDTISETLSWPGFPPQSDVLFGVLVLILLGSRHFLAAACEVLAAGGSAALWFGITPLVGRPRPSADLIYVSEQLSPGSF